MDVDPKRATSQDIIQISTKDVPVDEGGKRPVVLNNQVETSIQKGSVIANDHAAGGSGSNSKYFLPRWCPPELTHTQKRKLQRLRFREKKENEPEKQRDEMFNHYRPMMSQEKEWKIKATSQPELIKPVEEAVKPAQAIRPGDQAVRPADPETPSGFSSSTPMACDNELPSAPETEDDEQLVDYSFSSEHVTLEDA